MKVVHTKNELISLIEACKRNNQTIGFVPTMGALHEGHLSLVEKCNEVCDVSVVSIFVNPTQFNDPEDLKRYPRTLEHDLNLLEKTGCHLVFTPTESEIYPEKDTRKFDFGYIETVMEGAQRPGHFNGVGQVVSKLFDLVKPHKAFFGMKDFQQIAIIKNMVKQLKYDIEIVECPIVREANGLAKSSRNNLLSEEQKRNAPHIYTTLKKAYSLADQMNAPELKKWITDEIDRNPYLKTEYVEIVHADTLERIKNIHDKSKKVICTAVYAGKIRLIDNIVLDC